MIRMRAKRLISIAIFAMVLPEMVLARSANDPLFEQWAYADINLYDAWEYTTGSHDVVVAVLDNGFDHLHPDIKDNVWKNEDEVPFNGIDDDTNGYVDDVWGWNFDVVDYNGDGTIDGAERRGNNNPRPSVTNISSDPETRRIVHHGTFVAGLIGAVGNNRQLGTGVNWNVRLMNVKVLGNSGAGDISQLDRAIRYAVDNGADIINISIVGSNEGSLADAVRYAYSHGVLVVAAAGNDSIFLEESPQYPICIDANQPQQWVLGVSAINRAHQSAQFSNVGSSCVDITAPGVDMMSTLRHAPGNGLDELYVTSNGWSGTSFAAPLVSGAAALVKSVQPTWQAAELYQALVSTTHKTPPADEAEYAHLFGAGLLQVDRAVAYARNGVARLQSRASIGASFVSMQTNSGRVRVKNIGEIIRPAYTQSVVSQASGVAAYEDNGRKRFVIIRPQGSESVVTIYSELWEPLRSWVLPMSGPLSVIVADVRDGSNPEIVVAPRYRSRTIFRMYTLEGKELTHQQRAGLHYGAELGAYPLSDSTYEILAAFQYTDHVALHHYDRDMTLVRRIPFAFFARQATPRAGDIDGDGENEYVIAGGVDEPPLVVILESDGTQDRVFPEAPLTYTEGLDVVIVDYNQDGIDELVLARRAGDALTRVWDNSSRKIDQWLPFPESQGTGVELLPIYR